VDNVLESALNEALTCGYRHIDTATAYENEHVIGKVLNEWITSGKVTREELFIVTKVPITIYLPVFIIAIQIRGVKNVKIRSP